MHNDTRTTLFFFCPRAFFLCPSSFFLLNSGFLQELLQDSYRIFYRLFFYGVPTGFLWVPIGFLHNSYRVPMGFLQSSYRVIYGLPTGFFWGSYRIPAQFL